MPVYDFHPPSAEGTRNFSSYNGSFLIFQVFAWKMHKVRNQYRKRVDIGIMLARTEYSTKTNYRSNRKMRGLYSRASMIMKFNYPQLAPSRVIEHDNYCRGRTFKLPVLGNRKMFVIRAEQSKALAWDLKPICCVPGVQYLPGPFIILFRPLVITRDIIRTSFNVIPFDFNALFVRCSALKIKITFLKNKADTGHVGSIDIFPEISKP